MPLLLARLLPFVGPAWIAVRNFVPSFGTLKTIAVGIVVLVVLGTGGYIGWTVHSWGEARRTIKAEKLAVDRAELEAQKTAIARALQKQTDTLAERERSLEQSEARNTEMTQTLEALRAQSYDPGAAVLLSDDPWLRDRPAAGLGLGRAHKSDPRGLPAVRRK